MQHLADQLHRYEIISDDIGLFVIHIDTKPARFYLRTMVHMKGVPDRPFISACGFVTEGFSKIANFFLQPYVPTILSIVIIDNFISAIRNIKDFYDGAVMVALDVTVLRHSISHNFGHRTFYDLLSLIVIC